MTPSFGTLKGLGTPSTARINLIKRRWLGQSQKFERKSRVQALLNNKVHLVIIVIGKVIVTGEVCLVNKVIKNITIY